MASSRSFSTAGVVSQRALLVVGALGVGIAVTAGVVARVSEPDPKGQTASAARRVLAAASAWQSENQSGCPTLTALIEGGKLSDADRLDDSWGNRFHVVCDGDRTAVRSAGPDRKLGTADDFREGS